MISLKALYENFMRHTHTLTSLGAAPANHTHTLQSLGAAAANHTHSAQSLGLGMQLVANANGGGSMSFDIAGKTMGILYITTRGRWFPVVFAVGSIGLGINVLNRGGENADRDYDATVVVSINGTTATLQATGNTNGLGACYLM